MSGSDIHTFSLALPERERIGRLCDRFESALRAGERPRIEDFLEDTAGKERAALLYELIILEIDYTRGCEPGAGEEAYRARFPTYAAVVGKAFGDAPTAAPPNDPNADAGAGGRRESSTRIGPGCRLGNYELIAKHGEGGMGKVYRARQLSADERIVAVKVISRPAPGTMSSKERKDRNDLLRQEVRKAISLGAHPNIITIHEESEHDGHPFFSMKFMPSSLADQIRSGELVLPVVGELGGMRLERRRREAEARDRLREIVRLVVATADAVEFGHRRLILHRDLKPHNILLDERRRPYVSDFGLAQRMNEAGGAPAGPEIVGTPSYMAPEQARGTTRLTTAADVYSLGAILYELLTRRPPFKAESDAATIEQVIKQAPARPRGFNSLIDRDLEAVCLRCLEKNPEVRYQSPEALGEELGRWLRAERVRVRPRWSAERTLRWCRLKPREAAWRALVAALLVALAALAVLGSIRLNARRLQAVESSERAEYEKGVAQENEREARRQQQTAEARQYRLQLEQARKAMGDRRFPDVLSALEAVPPGQVGWETRRLRYEASLGPVITRRMSEHSWRILDAVVSPDGTRLVSCGGDGQVLLWDAVAGRLLRRLVEGQWDPVGRSWLRFGADPAPPPDAAGPPGAGRCEYFAALCWLGSDLRVAAASLGGAGVVLDTDTGSRRNLLQGPDPLYAVAAGVDGSRVLFGGASGGLYLRSAVDGTARDQNASSAAVLAAVWWEAGGKWVVGREDGAVEVLNAITLAVEGRVRVPGPVWGIDVAADGRRGILAVACRRGGVELIELGEDGSLPQRADFLPFPTGDRIPNATHAVRFAAGGRVYAADNLGRLALWDRDSREVLWVVDGDKRNPGLGRGVDGLPPPFHRTVSAIRVPPGPGEESGPNRVITAGDQMVLKVWNTGADKGVTRFQVGSAPRIAFDANEPKLMWAIGEDGNLRLIDSVTGRELDVVPAHAGGGAGLALVGHSGVVATSGGDGRVRLWSWNGSGVRKGLEIQHECPLLSVAASHDGRWVAAVDATGLLSAWEVATGSEVFRDQLADPGAGRPKTGRVAFNCDDTRLAAFGPRQTCCVYDTSAVPFRGPVTHGAVAGGGGTALLWHPADRDFLLFADDLGRYADVAFPGCALDLKELGLREAHSYCAAAASGPDGRWFLLEASGRLVVFAPRQLGVLWDRAGRAGACDVAVDRDGNRVAVANADGAVEILEAARRRTEPAPAATDPTGNWSDSVLVGGMPNLVSDSGRCVGLDREDRVCVLFVRQAGVSGDEIHHGALMFAREGVGGVSPERIDDLVQCGTPAVALVLEPGREPAAVFRRRDLSSGMYAGSVHLARRRGSGEWETEAAAISTGNVGFYPVAVTREGRVDDVFHFDYEHMYWLHSFRQDGGWRVQPLGRHGDGMELRGARGRDGRTHFLFQTNRVNSDCGPPVYACWDGQGLSRDVADPGASTLKSLMLTPDGTPLVLTAGTGPADRLTGSLGRRTPDGWQYEVLPAELQDIDIAAACGPDGRVHYPSWDAQKQRLVLWSGRTTDWRGALVADRLPGKPVWIHVNVDSRGQPVITAGMLRGVESSIHVFRQK